MNDWHNRFGGLRWRVSPVGVEIEGSGLARTRGQPRTMRWYWASWAPYFLNAAHATGVPVPILMMTVATENGPCRLEDGEPHVPPVRQEPGYTSDEATPTRISVGPCHVLISTARAALGDPTVNSAWLLDRGNNLLAAATYIRQTAGKHQMDPILVAACYNAGGIYEAKPGTGLGNRWHIRTYGNHLDRAAAWYGDASAVMAEMAAAVGRAA